MENRVKNIPLISGRQLSLITDIHYRKIRLFILTEKMGHFTENEKIKVLTAYDDLLFDLRKLAE